MRYVLYFPADQHLLFGSPRDVTYCQVYSGELPASLFSQDITDRLDFLFHRHNMGDNGNELRPRADEIRSMSVGDIVHFPVVGEGGGLPRARGGVLAVMFGELQPNDWFRFVGPSWWGKQWRKG